MGAIFPAQVRVSSSCLEYGVKNPEPNDVFAAVTPGRAFLVGHLPNGGTEKLDLSDAVLSGVAVLRGTGKSDEVMIEVRSPGWSELQILPGCVALPPQGRLVEVPEESLALVKQATAAASAAAKLPGGGEDVAAKVLARGQQEHLWAIKSTSWQALNSAADPLAAAIASVQALGKDPTAGARIAWASRGKDSGRAGKADLGFLGDFAVLRLAEAERGPAAIEVCTQKGVKNAGMNRAGVQGLTEVLRERQGGNVVLTEELLKALEKARLTVLLDDALAAAGHTMVWYVHDDELAVQRFEAGPAAKRRFVAIAPQNAAEARAVFGRNNRAAFAFKGLIEEKLVERVKTADELQRLSGAAAGERLVLVCMEQYGRIPMLDGSMLSVSDLPAGVSEIIACDALDAKEPPAAEPMRAGALTFDILAAGVRSAIKVGEAGALTRAELVEALSAGIQGEWQRQKAPVGPVLKWERRVNGDAVAVGNAGGLLKVDTVSAVKAGEDKGHK